MNTQNEIVIYQMPNGEMQLDVTVSGETIWLIQRQIAELFGTKVPAISKHLKNIFASGELIEEVVISKMGHYKIFCVNGNTGFRNESRIFYFIHLQNEEDYERKESSSA